MDRLDLLVAQLGAPLNISRIVYDPDDPYGSGDESSMSELARSVMVQRQRSVDPRRSPEERETCVAFAARLGSIGEAVTGGMVAVVDMDDDERSLFGRLTAQRQTTDLGLVFPLGAGEAATLAIAVSRGWVFGTDDTDAIRAMRRLAPRHRYQRIRKILIEAAEDGLIDPTTANQIHTEMRAAGFWDKTSPFADLD